MDRELIAMCDTNEIQSKWEPKIGDKLYLKNHFMMTTVIDEGKFTVHATHVFIPRIEDMLEWLGSSWYCLVRQTDEELDTEDEDNGSRWIMGCFDNGGITEDRGYADTAIKALIKAYMHLSHNKTWDGKAWI